MTIKTNKGAADSFDTTTQCVKDIKKQLKKKLTPEELKRAETIAHKIVQPLDDGKEETNCVVFYAAFAAMSAMLRNFEFTVNDITDAIDAEKSRH